MARTGSHYLGRVLKIAPRRNATLAWRIAAAAGRSWKTFRILDVSFVHADELAAWEKHRKGVLTIPAGFWELAASGVLSVEAPVPGFDAPFEIPPGRYHIVVVGSKSAAASDRPIEIPKVERTLDVDAARTTRGTMSETATRGADVESERTAPGRFRIRYRQLDGEMGAWDESPPIPRRPPPERPPRREREGLRDRVDPFPDVQAAMPKLCADIARARKNIWIAWWLLDDDFPTVFNAAGVPVRFFRDEIKAALRANAQLEVYILLWDGWGPTPPNPANFAFPPDQKRLHIAWQSNGIVGTHHEKFLLMDLDGKESNEGACLWCLGWNGDVTYWDSHAHVDPDPYLDTAGKLHQPWHDSAVRVVGALASNAFELEFRRRWATNLPPLPPAPPPTFLPNPTGKTSAVPLIHIERTAAGPIELWYLAKVAAAGEGIYIENQYFGDNALATAICASYLAKEVAGHPPHGAVVLCHPAVMSPFPMRWSSRENLATIRAQTARWLVIQTANGPRRVPRPPGGWTAVKVTGWWKLSNKSHVAVRWATGAVAGTLVRAISGVNCLAMITAAAGGAPAFTPVYIHSKMAVIDGECTIGSSNIGHYSFFLDSEGNIAVPDGIETKRVMTLFFPALTGVAAAGNLASWINFMEQTARRNYDIEKGITVPWAPPKGLLTEFPYD